MIIIPTVLAFDQQSFKKLWDAVVPVSKEIQVDIMDGRFVETKSVPIEKLPDVKTLGKKFEAHMMIKEPMSWALPLIDKGFTRLIMHYEALMPEDIPLIVSFMKKHNAELCLAINPNTPVSEIVPHTKYVKDILIMGVHPGINGAKYVQNTPERVKELHDACPGVTIQVDGGMTDETISGVTKAGATRINSGSFVGGSDNPEEALKKLYAAAEVRE